MKTEREAKAIQDFCDDLSNALTKSGNHAQLTYDNKKECVTVRINEETIKIYVEWGGVALSARNIIYGINRFFG